MNLHICIEFTVRIGKVVKDQHKCIQNTVDSFLDKNSLCRPVASSIMSCNRFSCSQFLINTLKHLIMSFVLVALAFCVVLCNTLIATHYNMLSSMYIHVEYNDMKVTHIILLNDMCYFCFQKYCICIRFRVSNDDRLDLSVSFCA